MTADIDHRDGFFETLGALAGSRQRENQLSRTFKACFHASPVFRSRTLELLKRTCAAPIKIQTEWECVAEVGDHNGGRHDIVLRAPAQPTFILESKVESVLTLAQLRRYKSPRRGDQHLVAVTKHRPEVPRRQLRREGIHAIRWQEFHRALTIPPISGGHDKFIANSFTEYLEGEGMAYRSQLSPNNLAKAARLLDASSTQEEKSAEVSVKDAFASLDSLVQLLQDLTYEARGEFKGLTQWNRWGPCYYRHDGTPIVAAGLWKGRYRRPSYRSLTWGFWPKNGTLRFSVWRTSGSGATEDYDESRPFRMSEFKSRDGGLDRDRVWHVVRNQFKAWGYRVSS